MSQKTAHREVAICSLAELARRERIVVEIDGLAVGVFFFRDQVRAWLNVCPHMGGPVCQGKMMPRTVELANADGSSGGLGFSRSERHIVCAWHGYEFDVLTGRHPMAPHIRLQPVPVQVVDGEVRVSVERDGQ